MNVSYMNYLLLSKNRINYSEMIILLTNYSIYQIVCFKNMFQVYLMEIIVNFHLIYKCRGQQSRWLKLQLLWSSRKPIVCTYSFLMTTHIHPQVILGTRWGKYRNNNTCKFPIKLNPSSNNLSYQKTKSWKRSSFHLKLTISSFFRVISIW